MHLKLIAFIKLLIGLYFLLFCSLAISKPMQNSDSLRIIEFEKQRSNEAKMNWLLNSELPDLNDFVKKNQAKFDTFSNSVVQSQNEQLKYQLKLIQGSVYFQQSHFNKAIPLFINILNERRFVTQSDSVRVIVYLKDCFARLLNYPKVFEMHQLLMTMAHRNPEIAKKDLGLPLSNVYINMGLLSDGIKYLRKEYHTNGKNLDEYSEANFYNNLGVVWQKANKPDSAIFYYKRAQFIIDQFLEKDPKNRYCIFFDGLIAGNIGQALMAKNLSKDAIPLLKKDIDCSLNYGNLLNAAISYNEIAHCYFNCNEYNKAEIFLDSALFILKEIDVPHEYLRNLKLRAQLLSAMGREKEAVKVYQNYNALNDSIAATDKEMLMLNQQIAFQTNELQEKIQFQEQQMESKMQVEEKRNTQRILMFVLLLLMLAILIFGYFSFLKSKKREKELSDKNGEITVKSEMLGAALKEKELLIKEVHHRVKNNMQIIMSLLKLQAEKINDKQIEIYFSEARNRIQSMALIHEFLYKKEKMDFMQMDDYIKQLILEIQISYTQPNHIIEIQTDLDPIQLDFDTSIPLGLIINELVTNAYKHAFPNGVGNIWVSFKVIGNTYKLMVKDNGIGPPENFKEKMENSLGMELIHLLSDQINADIEIQQKIGFEVEITFSC